MFLPTTKKEMESLGWDRADVIIVTGDTYIDSPYIGAAIIGKYLTAKGFRVGIIAQPDTAAGTDITRLGEPAIFWGVTGGSIDSMLANYTALKKKRMKDDLTPGGENNLRPDRAVISYTNLIRRFFKNTVPVVTGGIEASLRRVAHYDFWDDSVRRSILFDAKADILAYGMAEKTVLAIAENLKRKIPLNDISGICYIDKTRREGYIDLPAYEEVSKDKKAFADMFETFYSNNDPITASGLNQKHGERWLVHNPPAHQLSQKEFDEIYEIPFEHAVHPFYKKMGVVRATDTISFSITATRGCYGECNFCSIAVHQGRTVVSRSESSVLREAESFTKNRSFNGIINDVGGPTANMYGFECEKKLSVGACADKRCLYPELCSALNPDHGKYIRLLKKIGEINGVKKVFVASGIRYDIILSDKKHGEKFLSQIMESNVSGQMKIAPEHSEDEILKIMGKPGKSMLLRFMDLFNRINSRQKEKKYLTYYLIAAHPGCTKEDMIELKKFAGSKLKIKPEQVQIFTPLPSTYSALMYYTEKNPFTGKKLFVEKEKLRKENQKDTVSG